MIYLHLVLAIVIGGLLMPVLSRHLSPRQWGPFCVAALSCVGVAVGLSSWFSFQTIEVFQHPVFGRVEVTSDSLSSWFVIIVSVIFALGSIYGRGYLTHYAATTRQQSLHWVAFLLTLTGLLILLTTKNLIVFLIGWELMAIGSFFAVIFEYDHAQVLKAGLNYFVQSHIAVLLITVVFAWSISVTGNTSFDGLRAFFANSTTATQLTAMSLLIAGFGFKAGFVPFHSWLPLAHPAAPSHISAIMSGVIVKAGVYGIIRFGSMLPGAEAQMPIGSALLAIGITSGLFGILNAAEHRDFKRMLAYCTIENVGIISMGLGIGFIGLAQGSAVIAMLGFVGALFHTLNHAIFKALLFFGAGNVYVSAHTRNMEELGGLGKRMPRTALIFLVGSLAIGGLPPMGGFISELLIYYGFIDGFGSQSLAVSVLMALGGCSLAIIGGISMLAFTKAFGVIFLGSPRKALSKDVKEVDASMLWPSYALIALVACVLLFPAHVTSHLFAVSLSTFGATANSADINTLNGIVSLAGHTGRAMLAFIILILALWAIRRLMASRRPYAEGVTWGCGYKKPIAGIQYTSKSFAKTLIDMCRPLLPTTSRFSPLTDEEIFPKDRTHLSVDKDLVDDKLVSPGTGMLLTWLSKFQFIQNGSLQRYIVYGLGYVMLLVASVMIFG